ncbi:MAG: hypothetical protein U5K81_00050 [Trueperaceae bacterium]|nr:hypothetical protein [Trueperaceae bacterium]
MPSSDGTITPELIRRMREHAHRRAAEPESYEADRFGSPDVRRDFAPMGREIADALGPSPDEVCAGVGIGGALMGTLDGLAEADMRPDAIASRRFAPSIKRTPSR